MQNAEPVKAFYRSDSKAEEAKASYPVPLNIVYYVQSFTMLNHSFLLAFLPSDLFTHSFSYSECLRAPEAPDKREQNGREVVINKQN